MVPPPPAFPQQRRRLCRLYSHLLAQYQPASGSCRTPNVQDGFGIGSYGGPGTAPADGRRIFPVQHHQLFIDDFSAEAMTGMVRRLHQPTKCGVVISVAQATKGRFDTIDSYSSPQWNPEKGLWEWWIRADISEGDGPKPPGAPMKPMPCPSPPLPVTATGTGDSAKAVFAHPDELVMGGENTIFPQRSRTCGPAPAVSLSCTDYHVNVNVHLILARPLLCPAAVVWSATTAHPWTGRSGTSRTWGCASSLTAPGTTRYCRSHAAKSSATSSETKKIPIQGTRSSMGLGPPIALARFS